MTSDELAQYDAAHGRGIATEAEQRRAWDLALAACGHCNADGLAVSENLHAAVGSHMAALVTIVAFAFAGEKMPCTTPDEARRMLAACALARLMDEDARQRGLLAAHLDTPPAWVPRRADEARAVLDAQP